MYKMRVFGLNVILLQCIIFGEKETLIKTNLQTRFLVDICIFYGAIQLSLIAFDYLKKKKGNKKDRCNFFVMTLVCVYKTFNSKAYKTNGLTYKLGVWVSFARREMFIKTVCLGWTTACNLSTAPFKLSRLWRKGQKHENERTHFRPLETEIA